MSLHDENDEANRRAGHPERSGDERRRRIRSRESKAGDLKLWRLVRIAWMDLQESAIGLGDVPRVELAREQIARADAAIERLEKELGPGSE